MASNLDRQAFHRARSQKKLAEARALLSRLPSVKEQAVLLAQLASFLATDGDKPTAFQLLVEAQALVADRAQSYSQLGAQLQIANTFVELDPGKSAAIVERVIEQVNELAAAALVLSGFDIQQYYRNGELVISASTPLTNVIQESARHLGSIATKDLDRARLAADRFQRSEMRVMALLQIVQTTLTSEAR